MLFISSVQLTADFGTRASTLALAAVLPARTGRAAPARAEVVVEAFGATRVEYPDGALRCTVSAGVAARSSGYRSAAEPCRASDRALYPAKDAGHTRAVRTSSRPTLRRSGPDDPQPCP